LLNLNKAPGLITHLLHKIILPRDGYWTERDNLVIYVFCFFFLFLQVTISILTNYLPSKRNSITCRMTLTAWCIMGRTHIPNTAEQYLRQSILGKISQKSMD